MKYIDADKLRSVLQNTINSMKEKDVKGERYDSFLNGKLSICEELLGCIASLQQEQPEGWYNKAAKFWYEHCELNKTKDRRILILDAPTFTELVHDFYEIGLNARKEE